jgi:hypothetical protein
MMMSVAKAAGGKLNDMTSELTCQDGCGAGWQGVGIRIAKHVIVGRQLTLDHHARMRRPQS